MEDHVHSTISPLREIDLWDDGLDLTICFSGNWRRAMIVVSWLLLFALVPTGLCLGVWLCEQVVHFMGLLTALTATVGTPGAFL